MKSNLRAAEKYVYCWGFTPFSWFYNLLKLLTSYCLSFCSLHSTTDMAPYKLWATKGPQIIYNISALVRSSLTKQIAPDSSQNELSIDLLAIQIGCTDAPLASFLSLYGESGLDGYAILPCNGFILITIMLQILLDSTCK